MLLNVVSPARCIREDKHCIAESRCLGLALFFRSGAAAESQPAQA